MNCGVDLLSCVRSKVSSKIHLRIRANALRWSSVMRIASLSSFYTIWFFKLRAQAHFNNLLTANVLSNDARATAEQPRVRSKLEIEWKSWGIWQIYNFKWQKVYVVLRSSTYQNLLSSLIEAKEKLSIGKAAKKDEVNRKWYLILLCYYQVIIINNIHRDWMNRMNLFTKKNPFMILII